MSAFKSYHDEIPGFGDHHGFQMKFSNGYSISVAFGRGNDCDQGETTAETVIFDPDNKFIKYQGYDVQTNQTPTDVLATMNYVAAL